MSQETLPNDRHKDVMARVQDVFWKAPNSSSFKFNREPAGAVELAKDPKALKWSLLNSHNARGHAKGDDISASITMRLKSREKNTPWQINFDGIQGQVWSFLRNLQPSDFRYRSSLSIYKFQRNLKWQDFGGDRSKALRDERKYILQIKIVVMFIEYTSGDGDGDSEWEMDSDTDVTEMDSDEVSLDFEDSEAELFSKQSVSEGSESKASSSPSDPE